MRPLPLMLLSLAACGGGPGKLSGTIQGNSLDVKDALLISNTEVWLASAKDLCPQLAANKLPRNTAILKLALRPVATGDFMVVPSTSTTTTNIATTSFLKLSDTCANTIAFQGSFGTRGTVTVNSYTASKSIDGTFDMTFGDNDAVKGSFSATHCDAPTSYPSAECVDPAK